MLPLGTVTIEETKPPKGYILEGGYIQAAGSDKKVSGKYIAQIRKKGKTVQLVGGNVFTASDYSTSLRINKIDARTGKGLAGAKLRVTDKNGRMIDEWLSDGQELKIGKMTIKCLHTPGHTEGGVCYYIKQAGILFSGDTLFCASIGRTDFPTGSMSELVHSIKEKLFTLPDDTKIYPGHGESSTIAYEKQHNPYCQ